MIAVVTGANGLIGRALCSELKRRNVAVRAAIRSAAAAGFPFDEIVTIGDIGPLTDWSAAVDGADVVFHIAGIAHLRSLSAADRERLRAVNVGGTKSLVEASERAGIRKFVLLSTAKVHGENSGRVRFRERDRENPSDEYARAKLEAEQIARGMLGTRCVAVRTPLVYGPGVKANFLSLLRAVDRRVPLPFGAIDNERTLIFSGNLAHAMAHLGFLADSSDIYLAGDTPPMSTPQLLRAIGAALQKKPLLIPVPASMLLVAGSLLGQRRRIEKIIGSFALDTSRLQATGWRPPFTIEEGLTRTADWFRSTQR